MNTCHADKYIKVNFDRNSQPIIIGTSFTKEDWDAVNDLRVPSMFVCNDPSIAWIAATSEFEVMVSRNRRAAIFEIIVSEGDFRNVVNVAFGIYYCPNTNQRLIFKRRIGGRYDVYPRYVDNNGCGKYVHNKLTVNEEYTIRNIIDGIDDSCYTISTNTYESINELIGTNPIYNVYARVRSVNLSDDEHDRYAVDNYYRLSPHK